MKILIIEDDDRVSQVLGAYLSKAGHTPARAVDGAAALQRLCPSTDVVLLDLGLPDIDGIDLCRRIRARSDVPVIMVTARSHVQERVAGLQAGADDFLIKPYDVRELVARIEAVTRRTHTSSPTHDPDRRVEVGAIEIDLSTRQLLAAGRLIDLTRTEFDVIAALARYPGVALPRERIIREVWNTAWHGFSRSLEVHVASIRRKVGDITLIETVRGVGYRLPAQ